MEASLFDYELPEELIAQEPVEPRDHARLMVLNRATLTIEHRRFYELPEYLSAGDTLVLNNTRVSAWRLQGHKPTGGQAEVFLLHPLADGRWHALVRPGRRLPEGSRVRVGDVLEVVIEGRLEGGLRLVRLLSDEPPEQVLPRLGQVPLPPYIHKQLTDPERYQTVYARQPGSAAAPTAGLHFTPVLLERLQAQGVNIVYITLHVSLDTFRPLKTGHVEQHKMHGEWYTITPEAAEAINTTRGRIIAVGTTSVRTLESAALAKRTVRAGSAETHLYITPGYEFKATDAIITNFHMPRTTMLVLVSAFAGREFVLRAYQEAIRERYRFLSFGDAMLIL
ncbi:MAG: tRNA preQ1(34) S-adenosylmethionine ribosyltransferase-isomerase QueA [Armatimonadetes bacterium JP3_11]|jgi:S-adenosylmethionine:tRNA ribosyltransferase-isomerase|nr:MAG: tRNA preQ1(34) S-adenosylmethionine ribosyltransferase-isomerase QueA [Armatimonadetes bacterium CP1_7O]OYT75393.1 MAG: tRNA preQ1(34) S-adenosylmethionine ribosyltransferase-isomerase QueA [Armatimonadetes bacterium JP3_11]RMH07972.1 MAG: tRNA preQ1(34) S-adenosylmethionine ribosyltransferase-isomerase QueA [Armatimonadota bacterium]